MKLIRIKNAGICAGSEHSGVDLRHPGGLIYVKYRRLIARYQSPSNIVWSWAER